jgi:hypothetical protein
LLNICGLIGLLLPLFHVDVRFLKSDRRLTVL